MPSSEANGSLHIVNNIVEHGARDGRSTDSNTAKDKQDGSNQAIPA